jgi:hypothetical protein
MHTLITLAACLLAGLLAVGLQPPSDIAPQAELKGIDCSLEKRAPNMPDVKVCTEVWRKVR